MRLLIDEKNVSQINCNYKMSSYICNNGNQRFLSRSRNGQLLSDTVLLETFTEIRSYDT